METKKKSLIEKYLTNNGKFNKDDINYRKVYVLNSIIAIMGVVCFAFVFIDALIFGLYATAAVDAAAVVMALLTVFYFKKTNNYKTAALIAVGVMMLTLILMFIAAKNRNYSFYWLAIVPPITYFLLDRKTARIIAIFFSVYMLIFFVTQSKSWPAAEFNAAAIVNIAGATLCIILMLSSFEKNRQEVWEALKQVNSELENSRSDLRLVLDSSAEGIYGIDLNGDCTFCNRSCLEMLGYHNQEELLGKNMHSQIHHSHSDGTTFPNEECLVFKAFATGEKAHSDNEVFWRADGTSFDAEYYSYPKIKDGTIIGAVVTFMDISERKQKEAEIKYLSCYDPLTGLHNRRCFEENRAFFDRPENLPLSVIFGDVNGLKMTNDIFGHTAGDELIRKSAEIISRSCRNADIVARVGGDEFIVLLPKTSKEEAEKFLSRIRSGFSDARVEAIKCSLSLGLDTKQTPEQVLDEIIANAENAMYHDKTLGRKSINKEIIDTVIDTLHSRYPREKQHSAVVSELCAEIGTALNLPQTDINKLKRAGFLHDIGKIVLDSTILNKDYLSYGEMEKVQQHSVIGFRILNLFDDTLDLAEFIYAHHERWDGTGYPRGLKGDQIPLISRIIAVAETYERVLRRGEQSPEERKAAALDTVRRATGTQFDPQIAELFASLIERRNEV